jgi:hypothetical protein
MTMRLPYLILTHLLGPLALIARSAATKAAELLMPVPHGRSASNIASRAGLSARSSVAANTTKDASRPPTQLGTAGAARKLGFVL